MDAAIEFTWTYLQRPLRHPPARPSAASASASAFAFASAFSDQAASHEGLRRWLEQPVTHTGHVPVTAACDAAPLIPASENARMTTIIAPRVHDIGGLEVRRAVPTLQARSIGSFVFVDQMGPALMHPRTALHVRPHPHIGPAPLT